MAGACPPRRTQLLILYKRAQQTPGLIMIYYMMQSQITYLRPFFLVDCDDCCCFR